MLLADAIHEFGQIPFTLVAEQVIYLTEVSLVGRHFQRDIENQRLEQVQLRVEPEGILHFSAGAFQNNVCEGLGHQFTGADLTKAVPGITMLHRDQVEDLHCIALVNEVLTHGLIQFRFTVGDDHAFFPFRSLEDQIAGN